MKIVFDHEIFLAQRHGGISRYFVELIRELGRMPGFEPVIFAGLYANHLLHAARRDLPARVVGARLPFGLGHHRAWSAANQAAFAAFLRHERPAIHHATYYKGMATSLPLRRVVTVYDMIHEIFPESHPAHDPTTARKRAAVARADRVICISENTRADLLRLFGTSPDKTIAIPLGVSFRGTPRPARPLDHPYLIYVGARCGYKNAALLHRVLAEPGLQDLHLVLVGGGPPDTEELRGPAAARLHYVGGDDDDLATWYRHAVALAYPSRYEGFGIPPLEAMQCGCPVLASNASSIPEVVGTAGVLLEPDDAPAWVAAIRRLREDASFRNECVHRGLERLPRFTWRACAEATARVYESASEP